MTTPVAPPPPTVRDLPPPDRGPLIQRLLLGAGALCVLVAGAVYLAVSWHRIGTTGQASFALVATALAALAAHVFVRRGLRTSAEAFAAVAAGLFTLDLAGAHHLDVLGAARLEWWFWLTLAAGAVLVVTGGLALASRLVTYRVVAVAALTALPSTATFAADRAGYGPTTGLLSLGALVVTAGLASVAVLVRRRDAVTAVTAAIGAVAWWCVGAVTGVVAAFSTRPLADVLPAATGWSLFAVGLLVVAGRALDTRPRAGAGTVVSVGGPLAAAPAALVLAEAVTSLGPVAACVAAAVLAGLCALPFATTRAGWPLGLGALGTVALLAPVAAGRGFDSDPLGTLVLLVGAAAGAVALHARGTARVVAAVGALAAAVIGTGVLAIDRAEPAVWVSGSWTAIAVVLVLVSTFAGSAREGLLAAGAVVGFTAAMAGFAAQLTDTGSPALAIALLGLGAALLTHGALRTSVGTVLAGSGGLAAGAVDVALIAHVDVVEAYTLPLAGVALVAGLLGRTRRPQLSSWAWAAPAVVVAAAPSALTALVDPGVTRLVVTALLAGVVTVLGARVRLAAPLVLGAATEATLAVSQLAPYAVGAPRWVTLALAGLLLLTLGVLFERARRGAAAAGRWYAALR